MGWIRLAQSLDDDRACVRACVVPALHPGRLCVFSGGGGRGMQGSVLEGMQTKYSHHLLSFKTPTSTATREGTAIHELQIAIQEFRAAEENGNEGVQRSLIQAGSQRKHAMAIPDWQSKTWRYPRHYLHSCVLVDCKY